VAPVVMSLLSASLVRASWPVGGGVFSVFSSSLFGRPRQRRSAGQSKDFEHNGDTCLQGGRFKNRDVRGPKMSAHSRPALHLLGRAALFMNPRTPAANKLRGRVGNMFDAPVFIKKNKQGGDRSGGQDEHLWRGKRGFSLAPPPLANLMGTSVSSAFVVMRTLVSSISNTPFTGP